MTQENVTDGVKNIFEEIFPELKGQEFDFNKNQEQFENWDSFSHMELISKLEQKFNITLETDEVVELDTPQKIVELIEKKIKRA